MTTPQQTRRLGIIMNGVTGRMGTNQHLARSIVALRNQGGLLLKDGTRVMPDPILVGRNAGKLAQLAQTYGIPRTTTNLEAALANPEDTVYFDALTTDQRVPCVLKAIAAGKHVYCEKPTAVDLDGALQLYRAARKAGIKHGVVQDKLFLPGLVKIRRLKESGFFGRILSVKADFGYWVYEGDWLPAQRPSWNYRKKDGGGIILDMLCHWRYVLDGLFGEVKSVSCLGVNSIPKRWDENGQPYEADADDSAYATFQLEGGAVAQFNSSWCTRVRKDDLVTFHVDGTKGSAVAGLQKCFIQSREATPKPVWNPDEVRTDNFFAHWQEVPAQETYDNGFKVQWEAYIRHVCEDAPFQWDFMAGARGVQLAELGLKSWAERRWIDIPKLEA
jgi:predicted dehydrogenase